MNFYITTPIYYANDKLHIGHGYTTITADILARFHKLAGEETFFLTGMDEHGTKLEEAAAAAGKTPQQLVDDNHKLFVETFKSLGISNDYFIRTTSERHKKGVQKLLSRLYEARTPSGDPVIYKGTYEGLYCTGCEKFITEKELTNGLCPVHLTKPKPVSETNYFFRLSAYLDQVEQLIQSGRLKIWPEGRRNEVLGLIKQKLDDFSISRERVKWGIDLPFDPTQKTYVWVDALPNYITAIGYDDNPAEFDKWWNKSQIVHLMAKDILKFHAIYWPAMLLAANLRVPDIMFIHGYISLDGQKISKSLGNAIANERLIKDFGRDAARYLLTSQFPFHQDGDINYRRLYEKYNSDLANDYGNLVSRVMKLAFTNFDGKVPTPDDTLEDQSVELRAAIATTPDKAIELIRNIDVLGAVETIWNLIRCANRYFDYNKPWELAKKGQIQLLGTILYRSLETIRIVASLTSPIMPEKSEQVLGMLGFPKGYRPIISDIDRPNFLKPGTSLVAGESVFPRLQIPAAEVAVAAPAEVAVGEDGIITIDDFAKVKLRVAEVLACERVPDATKLLRLQISVGEAQPRQIVAGIAEFYTPEQLVGKKIIVVANLKPTKIRGIDSNGMLLAAKSGKQLAVLTVDRDLPPGATIS
jgi:methionyl-tRNA synthetase